jgi:hypothetical protein
VESAMVVLLVSVVGRVIVELLLKSQLTAASSINMHLHLLFHRRGTF